MSLKNALIHISPEEYSWISAILQKQLAPSVEVLVFGSRVKGGRVKPYSDLDLAIHADHKLSFSELAGLQEAFAESNLPYRVDVVDFLSVSPEFQKIILASSEVLKWR